MRPRLKVAKGWKYRVILVAEDGAVAWDDVMHEEECQAIMPLLFKNLDKYRVEQAIKRVGIICT